MVSEMIERVYSAMKKILCALFCFALFISSLPAAGCLAVTQSEIDALEKQREELKERQEELSEQLESLEYSMEYHLERKSALDEQSELLRQDIELLNEQLRLCEKRLSARTVGLEAAEKSRDMHYALYQSRVRDMEEGSSWTYLSYILEANSISELISRLTDISDIMSYDEKLREKYIEACEKAELALSEYEVAYTGYLEKQAELSKQESELEDKINASVKIIEDIEKDVDSYKAFYENAEEEMAKVQAEIDKKAEELRKQQEAEAASRVPVYTPPSSGTISGGYYMWPSATTYITSPFGPRVHPIYGQLKPHTGVDIGAWHGTEIYAAADGTVTAAVLDYGSVGYGTYVAIYHPNGSTTLYGHMSALNVSYGQSVKKGQVIGYVGSTGASNGPHIHFEIRLNGACVDPMLYF